MTGFSTDGKVVGSFQLPIQLAGPGGAVTVEAEREL